MSHDKPQRVVNLSPRSLCKNTVSVGSEQHYTYFYYMANSNKFCEPTQCDKLNVFYYAWNSKKYLNLTWV